MIEPRITKEVSTRIPTKYGTFELVLFANNLDAKENAALLLGQVRRRNEVLTRIHSECFTGDVLGSVRCDCGEQLDRSLQMIGRAGCGVLLYLRQEGRGIGLLDKLRAYNLQDEGLDTVEANLQLGHRPDERDYRIAALILADIGMASINLITNNPAKIHALSQLGVHVARRTPIEIPARPENAEYLQTKVHRMNHLLEQGGQFRLSGDQA
ncbi:MAG: GTP cyclohydrolase II [Chloroflexota bacterium]